jgi:hypothetical protein
LGIVVTEAAKNLLKHSHGGQILLAPIECGNTVGIEMLALDKGPGIADPGRCFEDGYSTVGTQGTGLGAIARLSSMHQIYSRPDCGTALLARICRPQATDAPKCSAFRVGGVSVPVRGEGDCGDGWIFQGRPGFGRLLVADGLGHGTLAADAARAAIRTAREHLDDPPGTLLEGIHAALRPTRGAAVAVAEVDQRAQVVRFAGLGNVSAIIFSDASPARHLMSHNGTAGHQARKISEFTSPWNSGSILLMNSDGLHTQWSLDSYPGLRERHPSLIAGVLYRDYARDRDDVTVVVAREARPPR